MHSIISAEESLGWNGNAQDAKEGARRKRFRSQAAIAAFAAPAFALLPGMTHAQSTAPVTELEEVVVTGVRASISKALEIKKDADSIIDSLSSEDIGKFPDNNLAEALQRIPGVAIDRSGGEGRYVSINGLGPEYVLTLLNGRQIASAEQTRSFGFDTIASELVGGINVYKTINAEIPEGGIGGTVDVLTAKPFNYPGLKLSGSVAYLYDENSGKKSPQGSFFVSDRFLQDKLGVLVSFSHQERKSKSYSANMNWDRNFFVDPNTQLYVEDTRDVAWRPWSLDFGVEERERTRNGGTIAVQFEANDQLTFSLDYLYSRFNVKTTNNTGGTYLWAAQDTNKNVIDANGSYTTLDVATGLNLASLAFTNSITYRPTTTQLLGFNTDWTPSDRFSGKFDIAWSKAQTDNNGKNQDQTLEMLNQPGYLVIVPHGGIPYHDLTGSITPGPAYEDRLRARQVGFSGTNTEAENKEAKADFNFELTEDMHILFGASYATQDKSNQTVGTPSAIRRLYHKNAEGQVIGTDTIVRGMVDAGANIEDANISFPIYLIDGDALRTWMADPANLANRTANAGAGGLAQFIANGRSWAPVLSTSSFGVKEKDLAAYVSLKFSQQLADMPLDVVTGVRYSRTKLASEGYSRTLTDLQQEPGTTGGFLTPIYAEATPVVHGGENTYHYYLPSINAKLGLTDELIFRAGASRSMTRPTLDDLTPTLTIGTTSITRRTASGDNPELKPFVSTNFDASLEWYYNRLGSIALAGFYKDASNFIVRTTAVETIDTVANSAYQSFDVNRPRNAQSAKIKGWTLGWTHALDMGLGMQANYTKVDSKAKVSSLGYFAVPGISDTANLVLFYEHGPIEARVAYNWRSKFLTDPGIPGQTLASTTSDYHQIDGRVGYTFGPEILASLEAVNLTNEKVRTYRQYENQFASYLDYGRLFWLKLSKNF